MTKAFGRVLAIAALIFCSVGAAHAQTSTAIILDASGSMNAAARGQPSRIEQARVAVGDVVARLDPATRLSLFVYGHGSKSGAGTCSDIEQVIPFEPASKSAAAVNAILPSIKARGYTPITTSITLAAEQLAKEPEGSHIIVLISDGKETCKGDPCAAAAALAKADAKLVIHAIGLAVDEDARSELKCLSGAAAGKYFDAREASNLGELLKVAVATPAQAIREAPPQTTKKTIKIARPGRIELKNVGGVVGATEVETGQTYVLRETTDLPAGVYNIDLHGKGIAWPNVVVTSGATTTLTGASITLKAEISGMKWINRTDGSPVAMIAKDQKITVGPGKYVLDLAGQSVPVEVEEGQDLVVEF